MHGERGERVGLHVFTSLSTLLKNLPIISTVVGGYFSLSLLLEQGRSNTVLKKQTKKSYQYLSNLLVTTEVYEHFLRTSYVQGTELWFSVIQGTYGV